MNKVLAGALCAALLTAGGCSSFAGKQAREKNPAPCPNIVVLNDAARMIEFDGEQTLEDVAYTGEITNAEVACRYIADKPIEASIDLEMAFGKGPKGANGQKVYNYFVAVVRRDLEVIAKETFQIAPDFSDKKNVVVLKDEIDKIVIPRKNENTSGVNFEIIVGFSLTPQQAIYNRSGKSLKFPEIE